MKKVICITDGDAYAFQAVKYVAEKFNASCIEETFANPTTLTGGEIYRLIERAPKQLVLAMFDDSGVIGTGPGEYALLHIAKHPRLKVLGILAVASRTKNREYTKVDVCVDRFGIYTAKGVDKDGFQELEEHRINGDTVYILDQLNVPIIVGIGDIGKMGGFDDIEKGCPITTKAIALILEKNNWNSDKIESQI